MVNIIFPESINDFVKKFKLDTKKHIFTNLPELQNIEDFLRDLNPKNVLEIGAGLGRGSVFFYKYFNWLGTHFYLLDGDSGDIEYAGVREWNEREFYSSIEASKEFCKANGVSNVHHLNAENNEWMKKGVKFDLVYSFLAIGFHWSLKLYLDKIYDMLTKDCLLVFGMRGAERIDFVVSQLKEINYSFYKVERLIVEPKSNRSSILILRRI